ncbi:MAG: SufB/SufD family protein [Candidatus Aminicenantia bacterium]
MMLKEIIESFSEPEWLKEFRKKNLELFLTHPLPRWKRVDISSLKIEDFDFSIKNEILTYSASDNIFTLVDLKNLDGKIIDTNSFFLSDISSAINIHPEILQKIFKENLFKGDEGKFQALGNSLWKNGFFIYIKKGSKIEKPILVRNFSSRDKTPISKTIIFAEENSDFTFVEDFSSEEMEGDSLFISTVEIYLGEGAKGRSYSINGRRANGWDFLFKKASLKKGAFFSDLDLQFGRGTTITNTSLKLEEENSTVKLRSLFAVNSSRQFDIAHEVYHLNINTKSSILSRGVVGEKAKGVWRGLTHVKNGAKNSEVFQRGEILLFGKDAKADAIPSLWIDENDCRASHGAVVFPLHYEKIFYLESRGIEMEKAKVLIGKGFLLSMIGDNAVKDGIEELIEEKLIK